MSNKLQLFREAKYGLFIHWGLYSQLGRGEWVYFKEKMDMNEYKKFNNNHYCDAESLPHQS